ncbi:MAG: FAD/NAD(P)-binding protein [Bacteroidota bacterium]
MNNINIGILGGGPASLFMLKRLVENFNENIAITIFERKGQLGAGMPYSTDGACKEHITNVSDREIPEMVCSLETWIEAAPPRLLREYHIDRLDFNEYHVVPRLVFGQFLAAQFDLVLKAAKEAGIKVQVFTNTSVADLSYDASTQQVTVTTIERGDYLFDTVVVATGHNWPRENEGKVPNWFDSPYPPSKLPQACNFPVAIKGSSLTAIDAVKTLARANGSYETAGDTLVYKRNASSSDFRMVMHSIGGLLPAIRFHLENIENADEVLLTPEELKQVKAGNAGFVPLDFLFQRNFMEPLRTEQPEFFARVSHMGLEAFVAYMMSLRNNIEPFNLFRAEYVEAEKSIRRKRSIYWKEMLSQLSYAMNYPAKHLSAEDMTRLREVLMPLISIVIAMIPQSACRELLALHDAGVLDVISVDRNSTVEPADEGCIYTYTDEEGNEQQVHYRLFVNGIGQPAMSFEELPFASLREEKTVSPAYLQFRSQEAGQAARERDEKKVLKDSTGNYFLRVPGVSINDHFQVLDSYGAANPHIYMMAVPYIAGLNPDYSGLDFCETASTRIAAQLAKTILQPGDEELIS